MDPNIRAYMDLMGIDDDHSHTIRDSDMDGDYDCAAVIREWSSKAFHVHVSVGDPDDAVRVLRAVLYHARHGTIVHIAQWHVRNSGAQISGVGAACTSWERSRDNTHVRICPFDVCSWNEHAYVICHVNDPYECWSD